MPPTETIEPGTVPPSGLTVDMGLVPGRRLKGVAICTPKSPGADELYEIAAALLVDFYNTGSAAGFDRLFTWASNSQMAATLGGAASPRMRDGVDKLFEVIDAAQEGEQFIAAEAERIEQENPAQRSEHEADLAAVNEAIASLQEQAGELRGAMARLDAEANQLTKARADLGKMTSTREGSPSLLGWIWKTLKRGHRFTSNPKPKQEPGHGNE